MSRWTNPFLFQPFACRAVSSSDRPHGEDWEVNGQLEADKQYVGIENTTGIADNPRARSLIFPFSFLLALLSGAHTQCPLSFLLSISVISTLTLALAPVLHTCPPARAHTLDAMIQSSTVMSHTCKTILCWFQIVKCLLRLKCVICLSC